ncbi:MAG: hypothetical protein JW715_00565 [Sedimentisphaerales bacterium]|nr:hypothetical protein [Sedimentisphaerales bacterium]
MPKKRTSKPQAQQESTSKKPATYKTFTLWQAAAIANAVSELANWIETVGDKKSTLNKIDALRKAIVYTDANQISPKFQDGQANLELTDFNDLLLKILDEILPYYKSVNKKPVPAETVENLKRLAEKLRQYAGEFNEYVPLETVTDEMRQLANDIPHYNYPDICLTGKASGISFLLGAIVCDLYESKKLTEDEMQVKSYLSQSMNLLNEFSAKRSWPKNEKEQLLFKTKISEDIIHFANQLDKSQIIKQYQVFSKILSGTENKNSLSILEKTNPSDSESNKSRKQLSEKDIKRFFDKKPQEQIDDLEYLERWILRIDNFMEYTEEKYREIEVSNSIVPEAERYDIFTNPGVVDLYKPTLYETIALTNLNEKYPFALRTVEILLDEVKDYCKRLYSENSSATEKLHSGEILHSSLINLKIAIRSAVESIEKSREKTSDSELSSGSPQKESKPNLDSFLSIREIARIEKVCYERLRGRLRRLQKQNHNCFKEITDRKPREPQFLYRYGDVLPIIEDIKKTSSERPAKKK